jgi:hypothetical protein
LIEDSGVKHCVLDLIERKILGEELDEGAHISALDEYIRNELSFERETKKRQQVLGVMDSMNDLFREVLSR